nr:MAG TPA: G protein-coupled glucose receptor regulating Gpa2 C-term [Caudoviricetes sp.]
MNKYTRGTETAHIQWAAYPCVYIGVWRLPIVFTVID